MRRIQILLLAPRVGDRLAVSDLLAGQLDMDVIEAPPSQGVELFALLGRTEADVLVVESKRESAGSLCAQVLGQYPHLLILTVEPEDGTVILSRSKVESWILPDLSRENLAKEIRGAIGA